MGFFGALGRAAGAVAGGFAASRPGGGGIQYKPPSMMSDDPAEGGLGGRMRRASLEGVNPRGIAQNLFKKRAPKGRPMSGAR